ncbi:MAG: hypothetical protein JNM62_11910 [Flavobacteriales bacterium]|nr:hypothetical protein [Flavobacteriales bacterium]
MCERYALALVAGLLFPSAALPQTPAVFHWKLDESEGTVAHSEYGGPPGILQYGAVFEPNTGHHDGAVRFDGVNDRIILGPCDITTGGPGFSVSVWAKPDFVTGAERTLVAKAVGPANEDHIWSLGFVNGTALCFRLRTGSATTELISAPASLFAGAWYHIAATYEGSSMKIHVNGSLLASTTASGTYGYHPEGPASFGARSTGEAPFSGWLDDIRIYDLGLTDEEIVDILFENEVTVGLSDDPPRMTTVGTLQLPRGEWRSLTITDPAGRMILTQRVGAQDNNTISPLPTGVYLISLHGDALRRTWPVFMP